MCCVNSSYQACVYILPYIASADCCAESLLDPDTADSADIVLHRSSLMDRGCCLWTEGVVGSEEALSCRKQLVNHHSLFLSFHR